MNEIEPGITQEERGKPQYSYKDEILLARSIATTLYKQIRVNDFETQTRISHEEKEFKEAVFALWGFLAPKVMTRVYASRKNGEKSNYEPLSRLDDYRYRSNLNEYLLYYRLLCDFIEEIGITRFEEQTFKIAPTHKILHGFVK